MTQQENAKITMCNWLSHPGELGKKPFKLEIAGEFDLHDLHYYIFKYKASLLGKWLVGVCGGYEPDGLESCGHEFSEMDVYDESTAQDQCIAMVENIRNYWIAQANKSKTSDTTASENVKDNDSKNGSFTAFVLLDSVSWDKKAYQEALKREWDINACEETETDEEKNDSNLIFPVNNALAIVSLMDFPVPDGEAEYYAECNYRWKDAVKETKKHKAHLLVSVMGSDDKIENGKLWVKLIATCCKFSQTCGIYACGTVFEPQFYLNASRMLNDNILPIMNWVYFGFTQKNNRNGIYTYGLRSLGKEEMEIINTNQEPQQLFEFMFGIVNYVLTENVTLKDGETLGFTEDEKIPISVSKGIGVDGMSIKIGW